MNDWRIAKAAALLAGLSAAAMILEPAAASAQDAPGAYDPGGYDRGGPPPPPPPDRGWDNGPPPRDYGEAGPPPYQGPPPGDYAQPYRAPPPAYGAPYDADGRYQQAWRDYQAQYAWWAAQACHADHANNTVAGALVGGAVGAVMGFSLAGWAARGAWALFGGTAGAALGAAVGSSSGGNHCAPGYGAGAGPPPPPPYPRPAYGYGPGPAAYAPPAYAWRSDRGWVWNGERWVRRPYRSYYGQY